MTFEEILVALKQGYKVRKKNWEQHKYLVLNDNKFLTNLDKEYKITKSDILSEYWELYTEIKYNWQFIMDNKILCWFWDNTTESKHISRLVGYDLENDMYKFKSELCWYKNCRPAYREEINTYDVKFDN